MGNKIQQDVFDFRCENLYEFLKASFLRAVNNVS